MNTTLQAAVHLGQDYDQATSVSSFGCFPLWWIQFHGFDCLRDRAVLTGPQKLVAGLGGSRSDGEAHLFFQLQCLLFGEYGETAGNWMDIETRNCCAHWNENSASSRKELHGTTSGWIHGCALSLWT